MEITSEDLIPGMVKHDCCEIVVSIMRDIVSDYYFCR